MVRKIKSVHGHYDVSLELEAERIKKTAKELCNIDLNWVEATAIAAKRSADAFWSDRKLKQVIAELRGVL